MAAEGGELALRELQAILHEELQRLPEKYRTPFVLCCLEGRNRRDVAQELGWKEGTVSSRIAQARLQLQRRLTRRGVALSAVLCATAVVPNAASAALVAKTIGEVMLDSVGQGKVISAQVAALADGVVKAMALSKLKIGMAIVLGASLVASGVGFSANQAFQPKSQATAGPKLPAVAAAALSEPGSAQSTRNDLYGDPLPEGAAMRLGTIQRRAVGAKLAVSLDGKTIIGVQNGKYVSLWDAEDGKLRKTWILPAEHRGFWVLSPSGRWLLTDGGRDGALTVWDVQTGKPVHRFTVKGAHQNFPGGFSPDENLLGTVAHVGNERLIRVWDLSSEREVFSKPLSTNFWSDQLAFSPDGKRLLVVFQSDDLGTFCWDIATGNLLWQNKEFHPASMAITPDGKILSSMKKFPALDLGTGRPIHLEKMPPISPLGDSRLTILPDGHALLLSTGQGVVVWDLSGSQAPRTVEGAGEEVLVFPNGKTVLTNNGSLQRWDLTTGEPLWPNNFEDGHVGEVIAVVYSADGKQLVSGSTDGTVRLWDVTTGKPLHVWRGHAAQRPPIGLLVLAKAGVASLDFSPDGRWIVSGGSEERVEVWDASAGRHVRSFPFPKRQKGELNNPLFHLRINPDGARIMGIFGGWTSMNTPVAESTPPTNPHHVASWDLKTGKLQQYYHIPNAEADSSAISPDGRTLVSKGVLIDMATGQEIVRLEGTELSSPGWPYAFSPDSASVVGDLAERFQNGGRTYFSPTGIGVWEAATGKRVARVQTPSWGGQLAFHPILPRVASSGSSGLQVCDINTGKVVAAPRIPERVRSNANKCPYVSCLSFSPDGRYLATGHPDGTILLWNTPEPARRTEQLEAKDLDRLWTELMDADAVKAWKAVWQLADCPETALSFLQQRLKPSPTAPESVIRPLLTDLDNDSFQRREEAVKRLKQLNSQAEPALRQALKANPSPEKRRRIEEILRTLAESRPDLSPETLRELRAVAVLGRIDSPEARRLLEELATGPESAPLTRQAKSTLFCVR
jgi:WD40 repeat protein